MSADVRADYQALSRGVEPTETAQRRVALLVSSSDVSLGHEDTSVAAGLGRQLVRLGLGVRLVPQERWYSAEYVEGELLVAMLPGINVRRLPPSSPVLAWARNLVEQWRELPALEEFSAIVASSELSRDMFAARFDGPLAVLPIAVDLDLVAPPPARRPGRPVVSAVEYRDAHRSMHVATGRPGAGIANGKYRPTDVYALPGIYQRSVLAVERVPVPDLGWGNHTGVLLDALANGSIVATNTRLGLRELGLDRLLSYRSAGELTALLAGARAGEFTALARDLREVVCADHTYARRAAAFVEFANEHDLWARSAPIGRVINFFPDWSRNNPYQRMLYGRLPEGVRTVPSSDPVTYQVLRDGGGDLSGQVLHVHWQDYVLQPSPNHAEASRRLAEATANMSDLINRGVKLVWTIHNRLPHDVKYYFHEIELCRFLARNAHVIHMLSGETLDAVRDIFDIDPAKVVIVEHGSYVGVYPELLDRAAARERLGLLPSERVVLFFGGLRPYKGLEQLLESFGRIYRADPTTRLLIVGQPGHTMNKDFLASMKRLPYVSAHLGFVAESDVHLYFRAADIQVAPYTAVLNSGSVLLGLGYGLPIVAPKLGALSSLAGEPFLFNYAAGNAAELDEALRRAIAQSGDQSIAERAVAYAEQYTGEDMSEKFSRDVLGRVFAD